MIETPISGSSAGVHYREIDGFNDAEFGQDGRDKRQQQVYLDRVQAFASAIKQLAAVASLAAYGWMSDPLREKVAGHEAKRADLKRQAESIVDPVAKAVNNLGDGGEFDLYAAIDSATLTQKTLCVQVAEAAAEGERIANQAIAEIAPLAGKADADLSEILQAVKEASAREGWPADVFGNENGFIFHCKRNVKYQAAKLRAGELSSQKQGFVTEALALRRKVDEAKQAAAKIAMRELKV